MHRTKGLYRKKKKDHYDNSHGGVSMAKSDVLTKVGSWSFLLGVLIAIIGGAISPGGLTTIITSVLIVLGLISGLLNVTQKETTKFLLAAVSLAIITAFGGEVLSAVARIGLYLEGILASILTFVIPAAIVVSLKSIYSLAADE